MESTDINSFVGSPLSEDKLINILDRIIPFIAVAALLYLVYPKSLYPTFISSPPKPTQLEVVLSKQDDSDARRAVANLLQDEKLPPEDLIKLRFYLANYAALENKELLRSTEEALRLFNDKQGKYTITLRLETIIKILKKQPTALRRWWCRRKTSLLIGKIRKKWQRSFMMPML